MKMRKLTQDEIFNLISKVEFSNYIGYFEETSDYKIYGDYQLDLEWLFDSLNYSDKHEMVKDFWLYRNDCKYEIFTERIDTGKTERVNWYSSKRQPKIEESRIFYWFCNNDTKIISKVYNAYFEFKDFYEAFHKVMEQREELINKKLNELIK